MSLVAQTPTNILHTVMEHRAGLTFSPHADFQALLQPTVLALVPVVLVDGAVSVPPAGVGEVSSHWALKEAFASLAGELTVMLPTGLVPAHHAVHVGDFVSGQCVVPRGGTVGGPRCPAGLLAANLELRPRICRNVLWPLVYYHCHAIPTHFGLCLNHRRRVRLSDRDPCSRLGRKQRAARAEGGASHFLRGSIWADLSLCI